MRRAKREAASAARRRNGSCRLRCNRDEFCAAVRGLPRPTGGGRQVSSTTIPSTNRSVRRRRCRARRRDEIPMRALAREHDRCAESARNRHAELVHRHIEGVDQRDAVPADITSQLPGPAEHPGPHERANGEMQDGNSGGAQLVGAKTVGMETAGVRLKPRAVERLGDLAELALSAANPQFPAS